MTMYTTPGFNPYASGNNTMMTQAAQNPSMMSKIMGFVNSPQGQKMAGSLLSQSGYSRNPPTMGSALGNAMLASQGAGDEQAMQQLKRQTLEKQVGQIDKDYDLKKSGQEANFDYKNRYLDIVRKRAEAYEKFGGRKIGSVTKGDIEMAKSIISGDEQWGLLEGQDNAARAIASRAREYMAKNNMPPMDAYMKSAQEMRQYLTPGKKGLLWDDPSTFRYGTPGINPNQNDPLRLR